MFGHDDKDESTEEHVTADAGQVVQPINTATPDENVVSVAAPAAAPVAPATDDDDDSDITKIVDDINATTDDGEQKSEATTAPTTEPAEEPAAAPVPDLVPTPETQAEEPAAEPAASIVDQPAEEPTLSETPAELLEVKKSALQELSPLLDELDQTADEKLNILMMTIQATDDQALLPQALATAKKIEDKKARAEAMLDIIQEINYFTKKQ